MWRASPSRRRTSTVAVTTSTHGWNREYAIPSHGSHRGQHGEGRTSRDTASHWPPYHSVLDQPPSGPVLPHETVCDSSFFTSTFCSYISSVGFVAYTYYW